MLTTETVKKTMSIIYLFYMAKLRGDAENDMNQDAIASLPADRCAWRKFVFACSVAE